MTKIKFLPFVGKQYSVGINGKKVLTLCESFYSEHPEKERRDVMSRLSGTWKKTSMNMKVG
jgi:hypothetical protein